MPGLRLAILLLPPMPPDVLATGEMPFLGHLAAEGTALPFMPEDLGATRQCLLTPVEGSAARISGFEWRAEHRVKGSTCSVLADWVPRRAFFRPFRRWLGRRWQGFHLSIDPAFVPAASLLRLEPVQLIDSEENLFSDLDELGISSACSLLDYPWLPTHEANYTWLDGAHQRDYVSWALAALASKNQVVYLELGHRLASSEARSSFDSGRVLRLVQKLDRQLEYLLTIERKSREREVLVISPEVPLPVGTEIDLASRLEKEHFQTGRDYVAVIHPTMAQVWSTDTQSRDFLGSCLSKLQGVSLRALSESDHPRAHAERQWGDWLAVTDPGVIFHPNHFDGKTRRRTAAGWSQRPAISNLGFAFFHGQAWALPNEPPAAADVWFVRRVLLNTVEKR